MTRKIPLFKSYSEEDDVEAVAKVIRRETYWATGPEIQKFEEGIADFVKTKYALAFNSGTSALHALLLAYNLKKGDEVIVPSFTFIATANAPLFVGAKPVFADIEEKTYGLEIEDVKKKITSKTKVIMPIHYGGCSCLNIKEIKKVAEDKGILLIEDAAQSLGARIKDRKVGCFGDAAMFSLCQDKMITTGEGGIIVTNSRDCYEKLKLIRSHGRADTADYFSSSELMDYITLGYNFRMSTILGALGLSQLKKIDKIINMRRKNAELYKSKLSKIGEIKLPKAPKDFFHVYQKYTIQLDESSRDKLKKHLLGKGILTKEYFGQPVHLTKFYSKSFGYRNGELPKTEEMSRKVLTLPMFASLTQDDIKYIADSIEDFFKG